MRKSYAMQRMGPAIARAISENSKTQKESAAKWAAAWGMLCGIHTPGVKLKGSDVLGGERKHRKVKRSGDIVIPAGADPVPTPNAASASSPALSCTSLAPAAPSERVAAATQIPDASNTL